jgi:Dynamin family/Dynamin central region
MGLGHDDHKGTHGTFSEDVLCLEICGPNEQHFSVIDVPGIFRKTTVGVTTKQDQEVVLAMVKRYMANPRSIMLTVVPANVDIATQEILTMAEEVDEEGIRTLGVLTKPDLVDSGAEKPVLDLVKGVRHQLELGWYILRNPGQKDIENSSTDRAAIERNFFRDRAPWNTLDKDRVGVEALQMRLQEILASKIRSEFPKVCCRFY